MPASKRRFWRYALALLLLGVVLGLAVRHWQARDAQPVAPSISEAAGSEAPSGAVSQDGSQGSHGAQGALIQGESSGEAIPVSVLAMSEALVYPAQRISATVRARQHAVISVEAAGVVRAVDVREGDQIQAGARILQLDCRDANNQLSVAVAERTLALKEWERAKTLRSSKAISEQQVQQILATRQKAEAQRDLAERAVERCDLLAPYSGSVTELNVMNGQTVSPGAPAIRLLNTEELEIVAGVAAGQYAMVAEAQTLEFVVDNKRYPVRFVAGQPLIDPATQQREMYFAFTDDTALAGSSGNLIVTSPEPHFPARLTLEREGGLGYFVNDNGAARFIRLPAASLGTPTLMSAVNAGDWADTQVVVEGRHRLVEGDLIRVVD